MISLQQIESDLKEALKARDSLKADTLRGLKVRIQNEKIAKMKDLSEDEIIALVRSEIKRRKEAAKGFESGGRAESAEKELKEAEILEKFLPPQISEQELIIVIDKTISEMSAQASDFGKVMGKLKSELGNKVESAQLAVMLKQKLK